MAIHRKGRFMCWIMKLVLASLLLVGSSCSKNPLRPRPISQEIAFWSTRDGSDGDIFLMNEDGGDVLRITGPPSWDSAPDWSPDGARIAFRYNNHIAIIRPDGSGRRLLTSGESWNDYPRWSPDGLQIAFTSDRTETEKPQVWLMSRDGSGAHQITNEPETEHGITTSWSPDGMQLAITSRRDGNGEIYIIELATNSYTRLTNNPAGDYQPAWSPTGNRIAFVSVRSGNYDIYTMNTDGSDVIQLTDNNWHDTDPAWSPDGTKIAFMSNRDKLDDDNRNYEVYVMNADGSQQMNITNHPAKDGFPAWRQRY